MGMISLSSPTPRHPSPFCRQGNRGGEGVSDLPKVTRPVRSRAGGQAQMETLDACRALAPGSWHQPVCLPPRRRVGQGASLGLRGAVRLSPFCHTAPLSGSQGARGNCPASPNQNRRPVGSALSPAMPRGSLGLQPGFQYRVPVGPGHPVGCSGLSPQGDGALQKTEGHGVSSHLTTTAGSLGGTDAQPWAQHWTMWSHP